MTEILNNSAHETNYQSIINNEIEKEENLETNIEENKGSEEPDLSTSSTTVSQNDLNINNNVENTNSIQTIINNLKDCPLFKCVDPDQLKKKFKSQKKEDFVCKYHKEGDVPEKYTSYCEDCKENLCLLCEADGKHEGHKIIDFKKMIKMEDDIKNKMKTVKIKKDKIIDNINNLIVLLKSIINQFNLIFEADDVIANNYSRFYRNIEILRNINSIVKNETTFEKQKKCLDKTYIHITKGFKNLLETLTCSITLENFSVINYDKINIRSNINNNNIDNKKNYNNVKQEKTITLNYEGKNSNNINGNIEQSTIIPSNFERSNNTFNSLEPINTVNLNYKDNNNSNINENIVQNNIIESNLERKINTFNIIEPYKNNNFKYEGINNTSINNNLVQSNKNEFNFERNNKIFNNIEPSTKININYEGNNTNKINDNLEQNTIIPSNFVNKNNNNNTFNYTTEKIKNTFNNIEPDIIISINYEGININKLYDNNIFQTNKNYLNFEDKKQFKIDLVILKNSLALLKEKYKINYTDYFFNNLDYKNDQFVKQINNQEKKERNEIKIKYRIKKGEIYVKIVSSYFVSHNENNFSFLYNGKEYGLKEQFDVSKNYSEFLEITLIVKDKIVDLSHMFEECFSLDSIEGLNNLNISNVTNISYMFYGCISLNKLDDISKWDTSNVSNMSYMFYKCNSLQSLSNISYWNIANVSNMSHMFYECTSLCNFPDISLWKTNNVINMSYFFCKCSKLVNLPKISIWNTEKVKDLSHFFSGCKSLKSLPDISNWNVANAKIINHMFSNCESIEVIPNISNWKVDNVTSLKKLFSGCKNIIELPDISNWSTKKVRDMSKMFYRCRKLKHLPNLSKFNFDKVIDISFMFEDCYGLKNYSQLSKWNTSLIKDKKGIFINRLKSFIEYIYKSNN